MNSHTTIDNLGFHASQRYALDQQKLNEAGSLTKDSQVVFGKIQKNVTTPSFHSECDTLLSAQKTTAWAMFSPPIGYTEQTRHSFTFELLPSLSLEEKKAHYLKKLQDQEHRYPHSEEQKQQDDKEKEREKRQKELAREETERKKTTLIQLLNCILHLNEYIIYANIKRSQYHKG